MEVELESSSDSSESEYESGSDASDVAEEEDQRGRTSDLLTRGRSSTGSGSNIIDLTRDLRQDTSRTYVQTEEERTVDFFFSPNR